MEVGFLSKVNHHSLKYKMQHQPNKKYKDLKQKQKAKIADWMFLETNRFFTENGRMPVEGEIEALAKSIYKKICSLAIWIPYEELLKEYEDVLTSTNTPLVETETSFSVKFVHRRQESEFVISQEENFVVIESKHSGLDSPENKKYSINLNELTTKEINNDFEDFILEFKSCL